MSPSRSTMLSLLLLLLALSLCAVSHAAPFALNNFFSSDMVLQRGPQQAVVWGWAEPEAVITATLDDGYGVSTQALEDGTWSLQLDAQPASLNHTLAVDNGTTTYTYTNIAFGDVYLCSGQSNMQVSLNYSFGGAQAMAAADQYQYFNLRLFVVNNAISNYTVDQTPATYAQPRFGGNSWVLPANRTLQNPYNPADRSVFFSATCAWTGMKLYDALEGKVPIGLVEAAVGGTAVHAWTSSDWQLNCGPPVTPAGGDNNPTNVPSAEYNAMIHPLLPMRLTAVLWYQGETDWWDEPRYNCAFPNLINNWRNKFAYDDNTTSPVPLPWYFVLIHPYTQTGGAQPLVRQAQLQALKLPNVGVANAIDLGDRYGIAGDIHPRNKSYVGERLARWLRRDIYGQQVAVEGPQLTGITAHKTDTTLTLMLQYSADSRSDGLFALATPDCNASLYDARGCCVQTPANTYSTLLTYSYPYRNTMVSLTPRVVVDAAARTLTVSNAIDATRPVGDWVMVAYAFADFPGCALYNSARLPALPFRLNVTVTADDSSSSSSTGGVSPLSSSTGAPLAGPLRLNNAFSNNMVLQRATQHGGEAQHTKAVLWGYGQPGRAVSVSLNAVVVANTTVSGSGDWRVELPPNNASFSNTIVVSDAQSSVTLSNVAFGDVFLCSGQSNMQIALNYSFGGAEAIAAASKYQNIRLFNIFSSNTTYPLNESQAVSYSPDSWVLPSASTLQNPNNAGDVWSYFSATCYFSGMYISDALNGSVAIGLVQSSYGGTPIQAWTSPDTNERCGPLDYTQQPYQQPSVLYNAMIHPLLPMRFAAVLWYQGESDQGNVTRYACSFPNLITDWREKLQSYDLPFYFVLIEPYLGFGGAYPPIRYAQLAAIDKPHVGVANAIDLGDLGAPAGDVHPRNKSYVGERLARWVRRDLYQQNVVALGPAALTGGNSVAATVTSADGGNGTSAVTVVVTYDAAEAHAGLYTLPSPGCTTCCGGGMGLLRIDISDGGNTTSYRPAVAVDPQARTLTATVTTAAAVSSQAQVTLALEDEQWPQCILYNQYGLPALPFVYTTSIDNGGGDSGDDGDDSSNMYLWLGVIVGAGLLLGVVIWLAVHFTKKRHAAQAAGGYSDQRRANLLDDSAEDSTA